MKLIFKTALVFSAVTLAALLSSNLASAAVVHTEFADKRITSTGVGIDLDGNGTEDFLFFYSDQQGYGQFINALPRAGAHYVAAHGNATAGYGPRATIPDGATWSLDGTYLMLVGTTGVPQGEWMETSTEKFVGLRLFQAGGLYYGWARVRNMGGLNNFIVRDWAFESQPNTPITTPPIGDVNMDGSVNVTDLLAVITTWGACSRGGCNADLNSDNVVDVKDLLTVIAHWGS